ncbi:hypothetical protein ACOSP7_013857 [Xanthoceras sorbifolium]
MILWFLWFDRNCFIHGRLLKPIEVLLASAASFFSEFHNTLSAVSVKQGDFQQSHSVVESLSWIPHPLGTIALCLPGFFSAADGEALVLREGLLFVQSLGLVVKWIESDALNVVNVVLDKGVNLSLDGLVINDVKALCKSVGVVNCLAISRKRNGLAHTLASLACFLSEVISWFNVEPSCIFSLR